MKNLTKISPLLFLILFTITYEIEPDDLKIQFIPSVNLNATAAFFTMDRIKDSKFVYFVFDFEYNNKVFKDQKDLAYFYLTTQYHFLSNSDLTKTVAHYFTNTNYKAITSYELNKAKWEPTKILKKTQVNSYMNFIKYYYKIKRASENKNKKYLVFRVPILKRKGSVTFINIKNLPTSIQTESKPHKDIFFRNLGNSFRKSIFNTTLNFHKRRNNMTKRRTMPNRFGYKYNNRYNNYKKYMNKGELSVRIYFGAFLYTIWISIFVLYFLVSKKNKTYTGRIFIEENNLPRYMNI